MESVVDRLQSACNEGKIISEVEAINSIERGGYMIKFSDGSTLELYHGKDGASGENGSDGSDGTEGATPVISIDKDGYWIVSYDDNKSFSRIIDADGNAVSAIGKTGATGSDGEDGKNGVSVRVVISDTGLYVFETYYPDSPDDVIDRIETPFASDNSKIISSIVKNEHTGVITLTMNDGSVYDFNLDVSYPTGIIVLNEYLSVNWSQSGTLTFRLNPSDAYINFVTSGSDCNIMLDVVSQFSRSDNGYVNEPTGYYISEVSEYVNAEDEVVPGQYVATVKSNNNGENPTERVCLVIKTKNSKKETIYLSSLPFEAMNGDGNEISAISIGEVNAEKEGNTFYIKLPASTNLKALKPEITSNSTILRVKGSDKPYSNGDAVDFSKPVTFVAEGPDGATSEYTAVVHFSNLPVLYMNTPTAITSKVNWTEDCEIQIWNASEQNMTYSSVNIKGRGNSTWGQPKKPYAIKLDKKAEVLGMPKHKRWVLLANYFDPSNLRNEICLYMGRISNLSYTPRTEFVDVVMNKEYVGLYQITEQLKIDENRVNVGDDGFLLEIDSRAGSDPEDVYFRVPHIGNPVVIKDPDVVEGDDSYNYIKQYMADASEALYSENYMDEESGWRKYLDEESFVDWYLINEITRNNDAIFFASCYMHLERGGKLKMGPLWDFDLAIANSNDNDSKNPIGFWIKRVAWYTRLFTDPNFVNRVKERFNYFYENRQSIYEEFRKQQSIISEAMVGNETRWNRLGSKGNKEKTQKLHTESIDSMCSWLETRFNWMKEEFEKM